MTYYDERRVNRMLRFSNVKTVEFAFFAVVVAVCSFAQEKVYLSAPWLVLAFCISFFSYDLSFLLYLAGLTGIFGIQMNGTDNLAEIAVIAQLLRRYMVQRSVTRSSNRSIRMIWKGSIYAILLLSINIVVSYFRWRQPIFASIVVNRRLIELLGIPLYCDLMRQGKLKLKNLFEDLADLSCWFCIALILQYLLRNQFQFLPVRYAGRVNNEISRILLHNYAPLLCLLSGNQLYKLLKKWTIKRMAYFAILTYTLVVVAKGRILIIAMLAIYFFELFHNGNGMNKGIKNMLLVVIGGFVLFIMGDQLLVFVQSDFLADVFSHREEYVRIREIIAYFNTLKTAPLLGAGVYTANFDNQVIKQLIDGRLFLSDIGVFGDVYSYGIFIIIVLIFTLRRIILIIRRSNNEEIQAIGRQLILIICITMWTVPLFTFVAPLTAFLMRTLQSTQISSREVNKSV